MTNGEIHVYDNTGNFIVSTKPFNLRAVLEKTISGYEKAIFFTHISMSSLTGHNTNMAIACGNMVKTADKKNKKFSDKPRWL